MIRKLALLAMVAVVWASAVAETVYLRDGRKLVGRVTRKDGKVHVQMESRTETVDEEDVIFISKQGAAPLSRPAGGFERPDPYAADEVSLRPSAEYDESQVTLPDAALFVTARQLEALAGTGEDLGDLERRVGQWRAHTHDRRRKVGPEWLTTKQQRHRRDTFLKGLKAGEELARKGRYIRGSRPGDLARKKLFKKQADAALARAAAAWPDNTLRDFLAAVVDLQSDRVGQAGARFRRCVQADPLVAAFHQGHGLALIKGERQVRALEEFIACVQLRDDTYTSLDLVTDGMKAVPGHLLKQPIFAKAKELAGRYQPPKSARKRYGSDIDWLLPGRIRRSRNQALFALPYDRLIARQALAVPIGKQGLLAVDRAAIKDADLIYVAISPGVMSRAVLLRSSSSRSGGSDVPLATILVPNVDFTPVDLTKLAAPTPGQSFTTRSVNLYRQMGTGVRRCPVRVAPDGRTTKPALLPGEPTGLLFSGEELAGFLTGRADHEQKDFGTSVLLKPADVAAWAKRVTRSGRYGSSYQRGPTLKKGAPRTSADGAMFVIHVLVGEKPPTTLGK